MKFPQIFKRSTTTQVQQTNSFLPIALSIFGQDSGLSDISLSAVYRGVNLISDTIGSLNIKFYKNTNNGKKLYTSHPSYGVICDQPNHSMSRYMFYKSLTQDALIHGLGVALIQRNEQGVCTGLYHIPHGKYTVLSRKTIFEELKLSIQDGVGVVPACNLILIRNFSPDGGYTNKSALEVCAQVLQVTKNADRQASNYYKNGQVPQYGYLTTSQEFVSDKQVEEIQQSWRQAISGNGQKIPVLKQGLEYKAISNTQQDNIQTREFQIKEVARVLNLNPSDIGESGGMTYSSIEAQNLAFYARTIQPWCTQFEQEMEKIVLPSQRKNCSIKFDLSSLLRSDSNTLSQYLMRLTQIGAVTPNEVRDICGFEAYDDVNVGNVPLCQSNLLGLAQAQRATQGSSNTSIQENNENNE